jgi:hypothetical protein
MITYEDYKNLVLETYRRKKEANKLSTRLINPAPARLKKECQYAYGQRYDKKDESVLKEAFGPTDNLSSAMRKCHIDKFRPLVNFLKGDTEDIRDYSHIELLAWLIDFQPRPFDPRKKYTDEDSESPSPGEQDSVQDEPVEDQEEVEKGEEKRPGEDKEKPEEKKPIVDVIETAEDNEEKGLVVESRFRKFVNRVTSKRVVMSVLLVLLVGIVYSLAVNESEQQCMYWTGDHYERVSCNKKLVNTSVIALDSQKIKNFRMIVRWDTISLKSLNTIFYSKRNNAIEAFTSDGYHPLFPEKKLKPMTIYIYNKYILPKVLAGQLSN